MNRMAYYHVVKQTEEIVWIVDEDGPVSVTNDAERVVTDLFRLYGDRRIIYQDTDGNWDELKHVGGNFGGFAPARHMAP